MTPEVDGATDGSTRARDLGVTIGLGIPGPNNAITDVSGVLVGHTTLIDGEGPLVVGRGPVRTGVTVVVPSTKVGRAAIFAGCHRLNGNGEFTGLEWVRESGRLTSPIAITNTHSVGVVHDALIAARVPGLLPGAEYWNLPVVGETWDGLLNDIDGMHIRPEHVWSALEAAGSGPVDEGSVGGGTGMICHGFKGGIGTSSRVLSEADGGFTVGVLVQANYGSRERLTIDGVRVGRGVPASEIPTPEDRGRDRRTGSIIVIVATDAPLLPHQCSRLAQRAGLGIGRMGGVGYHTSGDLFLAFATGNTGTEDIYTDESPFMTPVMMLNDWRTAPVYDAVVDATEEAIVNALVAARTMMGRDGNTAYALPHPRLVELMSLQRL